MRKFARRDALKTLVITGVSALWAACRPGGGRDTGASNVAIPTLAEVGDIQATHAAIPEETLVGTGSPEEAADVTEADPTEMASTPEPTREPAPWPSVVRGSDGILVTSPLTRFYETRYRNANPRPEIDAADWQLTIDGWVQYPQALSLEDIAALDQVEVMRTLECISNPVGGTLIGNTTWRGVKLADVLALAGIQTGAREVKMLAADGYDTSIPLALAQHADALLVFEMDGAPLSVKHGYPLRVLLPGCYGQKQPKWITGIEVITDEFLGYWEQRGWSNEASVQINSQIWEPAPLSRVSGSTATISGIAFADESGVSRVEISTDDGVTWQPVELIPGPSSLVWTEWRYEWVLPPVTESTPFEIAVRAVDGNGVTQRRAANDAGLLNSTFPDGTSDIHRTVVTVDSSS